MKQIKQGQYGIGLVYYVYKKNTDKEIRDEIKKRGLDEDLRQEANLILLEINNMDLDEREAIRYIARRLYRFMKAYGFRKKRHHKKILWWWDLIGILKEKEENYNEN